jgi:hypothetical protein
MSAAWPLYPEPDDPLPRPKLTLYQRLVSGSIPNSYEPEGADGPADGREPRRTDWQLVLEQSLDDHDLDPRDVDWPESEVPGPEWPDPSWPGFTGRTSPRSCTFILAVSPLLAQRHPDKAARLYEVFPPSQERQNDPEPDLEAEP